MKFIFFFILLLPQTCIHAQQKIPPGDHTDNFKITNGKLSWEKAYTSDLSYKEVVANVKSAGVIDDINTSSSSTITGNVQPFRASLKELGLTSNNTKMYISSMEFKGVVTIKKTSEGYHVVFDQLFAQTPKGTSFMKNDFSEKAYPIELYTIKKGDFDSKKFKGEPAYILNYTFNNIFEPLFY
ncbi:MAG: hypothetical protein ACK5NK_01840 [Niabella sp.]